MVAHVHGPAADGPVAAGLSSDPAEAAPPRSPRTRLEWLIEHATGCHSRQVALLANEISDRQLSALLIRRRNELTTHWPQQLRPCPIRGRP